MGHVEIFTPIVKEYQDTRSFKISAHALLKLNNWQSDNTPIYGRWRYLYPHQYVAERVGFEPTYHYW